MAHGDNLVIRPEHTKPWSRGWFIKINFLGVTPHPGASPLLVVPSKASMSRADSFPDEGRQLLDGLWVALPAAVPLLQPGPALHALVEGVSVAQLEVALPVGVPVIAEIKLAFEALMATKG